MRVLKITSVWRVVEHATPKHTTFPYDYFDLKGTEKKQIQKNLSAFYLSKRTWILTALPSSLSNRKDKSYFYQRREDIKGI